jgi:hypothetical protein
MLRSGPAVHQWSVRSRRLNSVWSQCVRPNTDMCNRHLLPSRTGGPSRLLQQCAASQAGRQAIAQQATHAVSLLYIHSKATVLLNYADKTVVRLCCQVNCAGKCCGGTNTCLQGQFCVPLGSTVCGSTVCQAPQQCAGGAVCCDPGASFCAGEARCARKCCASVEAEPLTSQAALQVYLPVVVSRLRLTATQLKQQATNTNLVLLLLLLPLTGTCCPSGNTCSQNVCLQPGQSTCGPNVCSQGQTCQGGTVCCDSTATFCNNGCCEWLAAAPGTSSSMQLAWRQTSSHLLHVLRHTC